MNSVHLAVLRVLALRPNGGIVRGKEEVAAVKAMAMEGLVGDVYELGDGAFTARITAAGRSTLCEYQ